MAKCRHDKIMHGIEKARRQKRFKELLKKPRGYILRADQRKDLLIQHTYLWNSCPWDIAAGSRLRWF